MTPSWTGWGLSAMKALDHDVRFGELACFEGGLSSSGKERDGGWSEGSSLLAIKTRKRFESVALDEVVSHHFAQRPEKSQVGITTYAMVVGLLCRRGSKMGHLESC